MVTFTGRHILPTNYGIPAPEDMAVQLGRLPRFAGATRCWWSVLHHLAVVDALWLRKREATTGADSRLFAVSLRAFDTMEAVEWWAQVRLFLLLHDGEETATGDIPTTWKTPEVKALTRQLEERIFMRYAGRLPSGPQRVAIRYFDMLSLAGEMRVVGPPGVLTQSGMEEHFPQQLVALACEEVQKVAEEAAGPMSSAEPSTPLVHWYLMALARAGQSANVKETCIV